MQIQLFEEINSQTHYRPAPAKESGGALEGFLSRTECFIYFLPALMLSLSPFDSEFINTQTEQP